MFCALKPASAALLGAVFLHERLGWRGFIGCALVVNSVALSHLEKPVKRETAERRTT